ncbi:MAG: M20/M25/M40 family metallo-hydrolase [Caldicoprobacterales bacterium]
MNAKQIDQLVEQNSSRLIDMLRDLIDIPTENAPPDGFEKEGQDYVAALFRDMGLTIDRFAPDEIEGYDKNPAFLQGQNYERGRKNVVGIWQGKGGGKSLLLSGHMDVSPKEPLPWTICEPFQSIVKDGRVYGRGSSDMKGGLAAAIMAVQLMKQAGFSPKGSVIIESVVDEEYASGNGTIASRFRGYNADFNIVMEPSGLAICPANVGSVMVTILIKGNPGMPYTGEEIFNIAYGLADMLHIIQAFEKEREQAPYPRLWENAVQKRKVVITKVKAGEVKPHGQLGSPIDAFIECSVQTYPGETEQDAVDSLKNHLAANFLHPAEFEVIPMYHYVEPAETDADHAGVVQLKQCAGQYLPDPLVTAAPFPCDLFAFEKYGNVPAVIFGPSGGNLHAPDEWVDIESMKTLTKTLMLMIANWCG